MSWPKNKPKYPPKTVELAPRFTCVLVPAEAGEETREIEVHDARGEPLAVMMEFAKKHFARVKLRGEKLDNFVRDTVKEAEKKTGQSLKDDVAGVLADMELVEVIPLVPNKREFGFIAVNMLVDDRGNAKELPINARATAIAARCGAGHAKMEVKGDAFFYRQFDDDNGFLRMNFRAVELNSEAPWMSFVGRDGKPRVASAVEMLKLMGNYLVKCDNHLEDALFYYEAAVKLQYEAPFSPSSAMLLAGLHANASLVCMRLGRHAEALEHAEGAVETSEERWGKAHGRRADALAALGRISEARAAYEIAMQRAPELKTEMEARLAKLSGR